MNATEKLKAMETHCDGCGAGYVDVHRHLVDVEDERYQRLARLCRGRQSEPKGSCLDKWLKARQPVCVVCDGELYRHKANFRARPVCKGCEARLESLTARDQPKRWFALDTYAAFGVPIPSGVHADYNELGKALLQALGSSHRDGPWEEHLVKRKERSSLNDAYVNGTVELTAEQAQGVRDLVAAFAKVVEQVAEQKHSEGGALLVKLARGEVTVDAFDQQVKNGGRE